MISKHLPNSLTADTDKDTTKKNRYKAGDAVIWLRKETGNKQLEDKTTRGLTNCVLAYVEHLGGYISEVDNRGRFNNDLKRFTPSRIKNGFPDLVACINGKFVGIEIKAGRDRIREAQIQTSYDIQRAKGYYLLCKSFQSLYDFIEDRRCKNAGC